MKTKTIKILFIEDNPGDVRLIKEMLREVENNSAGALHFVVEYVDYLSLGLQFISNENYDLILLDLSLPDSRGLQTIDRVKTKTKNLPVVVLTGMSDPLLKERALAKGVQEFLEKDKLDSKLLALSVFCILENQKSHVKKVLVREDKTMLKQKSAY